LEPARLPRILFALPKLPALHGEVSEDRRTSIATRTGDTGETSLLFGRRVSKTHPQVECSGNFDELNSALGLARSFCADAWRSEQILLAQKDLINLMGEVAVPEESLERWSASRLPRLDDASLARLDASVATIEGRDVRFDGWATPGANPHAAALDLARSVCRRAERSLLALPQHGRHPRPLLIHYINRLSDLLWLMAREAES
jgi:cob(I)alamin adenosyltransferase